MNPFLCGINVDKWGLTWTPGVVMSNATAVRLVLSRYDPQSQKDIDLRALVERYLSIGQRVLGIVLPESCDARGAVLPWQQAMDELAALVGPGLGVELWNEPDDAGALSSYLDPAEFSKRLAYGAAAFRGVNPNIVVVSGGVSSEHARDYLKQVDLSPADLVGIHRYNDRIRYDFADGHVAYWPSSDYGFGEVNWALSDFSVIVSGKPLLITEWSTTDEPLRADYVTRMVDFYADHPAVAGAFYFAYSDQFMPQPFGLFDQHGSAKPAFDAFQAAALPFKQPTPPKEQPAMSLLVGTGLVTAMTANGDHPIRDSEFYGSKDGSVFEKAFGLKGIYVASDAVGHWEVAGPFPYAA